MLSRNKSLKVNHQNKGQMFSEIRGIKKTSGITNTTWHKLKITLYLIFHCVKGREGLKLNEPSNATHGIFYPTDQLVRI